MRYVAIIMRHDEGEGILDRPATYTGRTKKALVDRAITKRSEMQSGGNGPYRILLGTLTEEVVTPVAYKIVEVQD